MVDIDELQAIELLRSRWRRARETLDFADLESDSFATGGLASYATDIYVRLVILPSDPEAWLVEFDEEFWEWWLVDRPLPFGDRKVTWWHEHQPTQHAAARLRQSTDGRWENYLALYRHGGIELGLGRAGAREHTISGNTDPQILWRQFHLTSIVGRLWSAIDVYGDVVEHLSLTGPWELSLALRRTEDAHLGHFGEGWKEPQIRMINGLPVCREPNLLHRREIVEWPVEDDMRELAFKLGGWIEDSWGRKERRFLANRGAYEGQFALDRALQ